MDTWILDDIRVPLKAIFSDILGTSASLLVTSGITTSNKDASSNHWRTPSLLRSKGLDKAQQHLVRRGQSRASTGIPGH